MTPASADAPRRYPVGPSPVRGRVCSVVLALGYGLALVLLALAWRF